MAGIPIGMQNPVRTSSGDVAFAQSPATSLMPYGMKTNEVEYISNEQVRDLGNRHRCLDAM